MCMCTREGLLQCSFLLHAHPKSTIPKSRKNAPFVSAKKAKSECAQNVHELLHSPSKSGISGPFENILSSADSPRPSDPPYSLHFSGSGLVSCLGMSGVAPARKKNLILEFRNESIDFVNVASAAVCGKTRDDERDEKSIVCTFFYFCPIGRIDCPGLITVTFSSDSSFFTPTSSQVKGAVLTTRVYCVLYPVYIYSTMLLNILLAFFCSLNSYNIFLSKRTFSFF